MPSNLKRIEHSRQEIEVIKGDITVKSDVSRAIGGVEIVFHLAVIFSHTVSKTVWKVDHQGTVNVAEEALLRNVD